MAERQDFSIKGYLVIIILLDEVILFTAFTKKTQGTQRIILLIFKYL
ncbi:MAG: hypothetical protein ACI8X3_003131 [Saprospiraceae bacterium]|jgi:hypothetical protein